MNIKIRAAFEVAKIIAIWTLIVSIITLIVAYVPITIIGISCAIISCAFLIKLMYDIELSKLKEE